MLLLKRVFPCTLDCKLLSDPTQAGRNQTAFMFATMSTKRAIPQRSQPMKPRIARSDPRRNLRGWPHGRRPFMQAKLLFVINKLRCVGVPFHRQTAELRELHGDDELSIYIPRPFIRPM